MAASLRPNEWFPIKRRRTSLVFPGATRPPPVPLSISFNPASPSIADNATAGTIVAAISVAMSDGSQFTGILGFTAPNNNDGGLFAISGSNLVTAAVLPAGNSTQVVTVSASQNGTAISTNFDIGVFAHGTGAVLTTFTLTSPQTGIAPFTIGMPFKKGQTTGPLSTNVVSSQVVIMRTWNDGSVKHAIISGIESFSQPNTPVSVQVLDQAGAGGTNLTAANIQAAAPSATVTFSGGVTGVASLSGLLASPIRTFISGPQMVECHYKQRVANGANSPLLVIFHVRLYSTGLMWIRAIVENGYLTGSTTVTAGVAITIGGTQVFNNTSITIYANTAFDAIGWIGGDPQVQPKHDMNYVVSTKLVPNYFMDTPSSAILNAMYQNYVPYQSTGGTFGFGGWQDVMSGTGAQDGIALLPRWDALTITSLGDPRGYAATSALTRAFRTFAVTWRDPLTDLPCTPSAHPNDVIDGGTNAITSGPGGQFQWEINHQGSAGFLDYLLTGNYYSLEAMQHQSTLNYLCRNPGTFGSGLNRYIASEIRGRAWSTRTIAQMLSVIPASDPLFTDFRAIMKNMALADIASFSQAGFAQLGYIYPAGTTNYGSTFSPGYPSGTSPPAVSIGIAPAFEEGFVDASYGYASDLEPLVDADMATFNQVRDFQYNFSVNIFGPGPPTSYSIDMAGSYYLNVVPGAIDTTDVRQWFQSWSALYNDPANFNGTPFQGTFLLGASGEPGLADGFLANKIPGLTYAVDHGKAGAPASYNRLLAQSNYSTYRAAVNGSGGWSQPGYGDSPAWGTQPRVSTTDALAQLLATMSSNTWKLLNATGGNGLFQNAALPRTVQNFSGNPSAGDAWSTNTGVSNAASFPGAGIGSDLPGMWAFGGPAISSITGLVVHTGGGHDNGGDSGWYTADPIAGAASILANGGVVGPSSGLVWQNRVKGARMLFGSDPKPPNSQQVASTYNPTTNAWYWATTNADGIDQVLVMHSGAHVLPIGNDRYICGGFAGYSPDASACPGRASIYDNQRPVGNPSNPNLILYSDQTLAPTGRPRTVIGWTQFDNSTATYGWLAYDAISDSLFWAANGQLGKWANISSGTPTWAQSLASSGGQSFSRTGAVAVIPDPVNPGAQAFFGILDGTNDNTGRFGLWTNINGSTPGFINTIFSSISGLTTANPTRSACYNSDQNFLVVWEGDGHLYKITPSSNATGSGWTYSILTSTATGDVPVYDPTTFPISRIQYLSKYKCYIGCTQGQVWIYKP